MLQRVHLGWQTDSSYMALSANQILSLRASANRRATLKYQFELISFWQQSRKPHRFIGTT